MGTFRWTAGGPSWLQGWRPPKKVYFKLGLARAGAAHLPVESLDDVEIVKYQPVQVVEKLNGRERQIKRLKTKLESRRESLNYAGSQSWKVTYEKEIQTLEASLRSLGVPEDEIRPADEGKFEI